MTNSKIEIDTFDFIDAINLTTSQDQIVQLFVSHLDRYGFTDFLITHMPPPQVDLEAYVILSGWSEEWFDHYITQRYYTDDPMAKHTRETANPFFWSEVPRDYQEYPEVSRVMNEAAEFGLKEGFSVPIYGASGLQSCVTMGGNSIDVPPRGRHAIHLMSIYVHHCAEKIITPPLNHPLSQKLAILTKREQECLRWVARGKTDWEISEILMISEHTVNAHVRRTMTKYKSFTRTQAVVKALISGEITV